MLEDYAGKVSIERDKKSGTLIITKTDSEMFHQQMHLTDFQFRTLVVLYGEMVGLLKVETLALHLYVSAILDLCIRIEVYVCDLIALCSPPPPEKPVLIFPVNERNERVKCLIG